VIVSDSTLENPGVIYGLLREASFIEPTPVRLLWIAVCPGAGAAELARAWQKAPKCHYGLTVINHNDCVQGTLYDFTPQHEAHLQALIRLTHDHCTVRADLFINHAKFYPTLDPAYARLVPRYTRAARQAGATVHDGEDALGSIQLRDSMHFAAESTREIVDMYISAVRSMLELPATRDGQRDTDERLATAPENLQQEEETDPEDSEEEWLPGLHPEPLESAEEVRQELLENFKLWNDGLRVKKAVPRCLLEEGQWLLPYCMPAALSELDARFHEEKKKRVFVCDTPDCEQVVRFSFAADAKKTGFRRADCEFAGSFSSQDWEDLPPRFRKEAWEKRFINATWHCAHLCGAETTLNDEQKKRRQQRILRWQEEQAAAARGPAPTSSSAASSANPPRGKGAKGKSSGYEARGKGAQAGQAKRTWEEMQGAKSSGMKKGGSTPKGQASRRRRW